MLEQHQLRYLERLWKTQDNEVGKKQEPWFYLVLGLCAVFMVFNPFPDWKLGEMSKLISIVYVLLTTISTSILWIMKFELKQRWKMFIAYRIREIPNR
jgi:hypothetical protein